MPVKKNAAEIVARINEVKAFDWMGTQINDLIVYLPFESAKDFLKPEATASDWEQSSADPLASAKDYLSFAWDKANNCRGLSASRSLDHLKTWLWLAGFGALVDQHFPDYERYGKKQLVMASHICGFDWKAHDNGSWVDGEESPSLSPSEIEREADEATALVAGAVEAQL